MARRPRTSRALGPALPTPIQSSHTTPLSSAYPSTYASEVELDVDELATTIDGLMLRDPSGKSTGLIKKPRKAKPFPFLNLPSELRIKIYGYHFADTPNVIDLDPDNHKRIHKKLALLRVCRTVYSEAAYVFYSTHTFRLFPTHPGRFFKTKKPLLARMTPGQRANIYSLELRLGPGWNKPPRGWVVNDALGLADCINVRKLTVFVECDPGDSVFKGFRHADGFYEGFSRGLLEDVLYGLPQLERIHFDAWSSVNKSGGMMSGLFETSVAHGRQICWGPERGWTDLEEEVLDKTTHAATATALLNEVGMNVVVVG
ncbi:hypothetical protein GQ53DRAFT_455636 [Thozetella sp. PMI_491]|nr:hypothetical protein GQ53DRAFT_455636 [Thozetella sp. PMI_491]